TTGYFGTQKSTPGDARFGLQVLGSKGIIQLTTGSLPAAYFLDDPTWFPGKTKAAWQEITSAGLGKPEPQKDTGLGLGNIWIAKDLLRRSKKTANRWEASTTAGPRWR